MDNLKTCKFKKMYRLIKKFRVILTTGERTEKYIRYSHLNTLYDFAPLLRERH